MGLAGINQGEWGLSDIRYWGGGLPELVDIKGDSRNEKRVVGVGRY